MHGCTLFYSLNCKRQLDIKTCHYGNTKTLVAPDKYVHVSTRILFDTNASLVLEIDTFNNAGDALRFHAKEFSIFFKNIRSDNFDQRSMRTKLLTQATRAAFEWHLEPPINV